MNGAELCQYVKHYIEEDKTRSAIMLNGEWGTGKSYFIEKELVPFLGKDENGSHRCVSISLYGLKDISEISKAIYFDLRLKKIHGASEAAQTSSVLAHTVTKGFASFFGIDLGADDTKLQELYESIDLSGKLIILEDVERTEIPLLTLMGYVNNMAEHDATKVLLVANEDAIIKTEKIVQDAKDGKKKELVYTEATLEYLRIKEKTISDTIRFECDEKSAIEQIMADYDALHELITPEVISDVTTIMLFKQTHNLRSFLFACQKTSDIFKCLTGIHCQEEFKKAIFYGIVAFSLSWKQNNLLPWKGDDFLSVDMGIANYPLFKFCYDYIRFQIIECEKIPLAQEAFENLQRYDVRKSRNDPDIMTIDLWYLKNEYQVLEAIRSIEERLDNPDDISYYEYGNLIVNLLNIREILGISIDKIKEKIIGNLHGKANVLNQDQLFHMTIDPNKEELYSEYKEIKNQMVASMNKYEDELIGWSYRPENAASIYRDFLEHRVTLSYEGKFILGLNPEKFARMFLAANAEQMMDLRRIILAIYPRDSISVPSNDERAILSSIGEQLKAGHDDACLDRIQNMHYRYFLEHLKCILSRK